jgi:hypothetical protein
MNYMCTLWLGSSNFPKSFRPFQKPRSQKSNIKEVHKLKFRHCLCVVAHDLKIPSVCVSPHPELQVTFIAWLEIQSPYAFWKLHTLLLWKKIKHDILSVSKSVVWYQKYMHIKVCAYSSLPSNRYTPRACRQVKMMFIPVNGKVNYTQAKAYCPISLLSIMQKMMQKF